MTKLRDYESDVTRLLRDLVREHPELAEAQRTGRAMWWDRRLDPDSEREFRAASVPQKPYVYDCWSAVSRPPAVTPPSP